MFPFTRKKSPFTNVSENARPRFASNNSISSTTSDPKSMNVMPISGQASKRTLTQRILQRLGLRKNTSKGAVAAMSEQASLVRANMDTLAMSTALLAGAITIASFGTAIPFSAALLGLAVLLQRVGSQVGMNIELRSNLMIIQHEVDRFYKIAKVMETIAEENGFELNTGSVKTFVGKLTTFIAMLANEEVAKGIQAFRQSSSSNPLQTSNNVSRLNPKAFTGVVNFSAIKGKGTFQGLFNRTFATGEYLRQLIRDITILDVFMTILMGEFQIFYLYQGDANKKGWTTTSPEFKSMLFDTMRLAKLPPKALSESLDNFKRRQQTLMQGKLTTYKNFYRGFTTTAEPSQEEFQQASQFAVDAIQAAQTTLENPSLQQEFAENKEKEQAAIQEVVEGQLVEEAVKDKLDPSKVQAIEQQASVAAQALTNNPAGGRRRSNPTGRSRRLKTQRRRKHSNSRRV